MHDPSPAPPPSTSPDGLSDEADRRFAARRSETGARDPREYYRGLLRGLRETDPDAYRTLVERYEAEVVQAIAAEGADPLEAWLAFGAVLAQAVAGPGGLHSVDATGQSAPAAPPLPWDALLLHIPEGKGGGGRGGRALPVGLPPELSPAQRATVDLLVHGKVRSEAPPAATSPALEPPG